MYNLRHELIITSPKASCAASCHRKIKGVKFKRGMCQKALEKGQELNKHPRDEPVIAGEPAICPFAVGQTLKYVFF